MIVSAEDLADMSASEGSAAAQGLARLFEHLLQAGIIDKALVSEIRDGMLLGLDPSGLPADARGLQLAYKNTLVRYEFLGTKPRELFYPDSEGAAALQRLIAGL